METIALTSVEDDGLEEDVNRSLMVKNSGWGDDRAVLSAEAEAIPLVEDRLEGGEISKDIVLTQESNNESFDSHCLGGVFKYILSLNIAGELWKRYGPAQAGLFDFYMMGLTLISGGVSFGWNGELVNGFWEVWCGLIVMAIGYWCLTLCLAEMATALPFNGGVFGFVRLALGSYAGFLAGATEALESVLCVVTTVQPLGRTITRMTDFCACWEPIYWAVFYLAIYWICSAGGRRVWMFFRVIGVSFLILMVIYILGSLGYVDYDRYVVEDSSDNVTKFHGARFVEALPTSAWFFVGVECLPLAGSAAKDAKSTVAKSMIATISTFTVLAIVIPFLVCSQAPGLTGVMGEFFPLNFGYARMFKTSIDLASFCGIPILIGNAGAFAFIGAKQLTAMGNSGYISSLKVDGNSKRMLSFRAVITVLAICMSINCLALIPGASANFFKDFFMLTLLGSFCVYLWMFVSYYVFRSKYHRSNGGFQNPFGIYAAALGFAIYLLAIISVIAVLNGGNYRIVVYFAGYIILVSIGYYFYASRNITYSEEEQNAMFGAYVIKANIAKRTQSKGRNHKVARIVSGQSSVISSNSNHSDPRETSESQSQCQSVAIVSNFSEHPGNHDSESLA